MAILSPIIPHSMDPISIMYILDTQIHLSHYSPLFSHNPNENISSNSHSHIVLSYLHSPQISSSQNIHIPLIYYFSIIIIIIPRFMEFINSLSFMPPLYDVKINFLSNLLNSYPDKYLNQIIN